MVVVHPCVAVHMHYTLDNQCIQILEGIHLCIRLQCRLQFMLCAGKPVRVNLFVMCEDLLMEM